MNDRTLTAATPASHADTYLGAPQLRANPTVPRPGDRICRFVVVRELGAGGMGLVVVAHDPNLGRNVAVKLLQSRPAAHRGAQRATARFLTEARAMALVTHRNVVAVYEVGQSERGPFIAMELVEGGTLATWLREDRRTVKQIVSLFARAGEGLAAIHRANLVHRDFKPANVLVGRDGRVKITDFGLSAQPKTVAQLPGPGRHSFAQGSQSVPGTPRYMAPEQHAGLPIDQAVDQFAFCVALYRALYKQVPFAGHDYKSIAGNVLAGNVRPTPPTDDVSDRLHRIIVRGLRTLPEQRWPSMVELLAALRRSSNGSPQRYLAMKSHPRACCLRPPQPWRATL